MDQDGKTTRTAGSVTTEQHLPAAPEQDELVPARPASLPAVVPAVKRAPARKWRLRIALALAVLAGTAGASYYWWQHIHAQLPPGIASGNGRLEADEIDIDTKYAGRIAEILADEGDMVTAGQVVARMDTRDIEASLKKAQAQEQQAKRAIDEANADVDQQSSQALLAKQEMDRATYLVQKGFQTKEVVDQRRHNSTLPMRRSRRRSST